MVIGSILVDDKDKKFRLFEGTFLLTDISMDMAFGMLSFMLSHIQIDFNDWELR